MIGEFGGVIPPRAEIRTQSFRPCVILGPPGTGKTTALIRLLDEELRRGTKPERIMFVTFSRAGSQEVRDRVAAKFSLHPDRCLLFRTIHSVAFRLLGLRTNQVMQGKRWRELEERFGYFFSKLTRGSTSSDEGPSEPPRETEDDFLRYAYEWGQSRQLSPEQTLARFPADGLRADQFLLFVKRVQKFKAEHGLLEFSDFLLEVLRRGLRPDVDVGFLDEAQDLSPLEIAVVEQWMGPCERSYVAGDDDQAIYIFKGADPDWVGGLATRTKPTILDQSYRVPIRIHELADAIIRQNANRVPKSYQPTSELGDVVRVDRDEALRLIDGNAPTLVLARNRRYLRFYAQGLIQLGIPFLVEGGGAPCPLSSRAAVHAVRSVLRLQSGERVAEGDIDSIVSFISRESALAVRSQRARQQKMRKGKSLFESIRLVSSVDLESILQMMEHLGPIGVLELLPDETRAYFEALATKYGQIPEPQVRLTSIHGAKGREADLVVVDPSMSKATFAEYCNTTKKGRESENRVFYVAVTRARKRLVLVRSHTRRHFEFPVVKTRDGSHA